MKLLIATGGTGGHIYPALDLATIIKEKDNSADIIFFGSNLRMESKVIPERGFKFYGCDVKSTSGNILNKFASLISIVKGRSYCLKLLKKEKADIVVAFGNYISIPMVLAAKKLNIPVILHEQNSFVGKANIMLSKYADTIIGCYENNKNQVGEDKFLLLGNPSATIAANTKIDNEYINSLNIDLNKPLVSIMLGSLGSESVSEIIDKAILDIDEDIQVLIAHGKSNEYVYKNIDRDNIKIVDYLEGKQALLASDVVVSRAGATSIAEICAIGTAAIIIPSPFVANNHQFYNANELAKKDACILIEEKNLNPKLLADNINTLIKNEKKRVELHNNVLKLGYPNAGYDIYDCIKKVLNKYGRVV